MTSPHPKKLPEPTKKKKALHNTPCNDQKGAVVY